MADEGFRLMPSTMIAKKRPFSTVEIVVLLELPPKVEKQYEYKLLATTKTSTLQKEVLEAQAAGFVIIAMVSRGEHMVIMERDHRQQLRWTILLRRGLTSLFKTIGALNRYGR